MATVQNVSNQMKNLAITDKVSEKKIEIVPGIHFGNRGNTFRTLIKSILKKGNIKRKYMDILLTEESLKIYSNAFTSESVDDVNNYQVLEQLGDLSGNKFIVQHIYRRFPQLKCAEGVKVVARLRINYGSKNSFSKIAEDYGFWDFITATNELRLRERRSLLEDVFEAFLGATEQILDDSTITEEGDSFGLGYANVYRILTAIFNDIPISLEYEDLYDAKTRLKELFDLHGTVLGPLIYTYEKGAVDTTVFVHRLKGASYEVRPDGTVNMQKINYPSDPVARRDCRVLIGKGTATLKDEAEQVAAGDALSNLASQGYIKHAPAIYARFSGKTKAIPRETNRNDVLRICERPEAINDQFPTRGKSKYQSKYTSPPITHFCRKRDLKGIELCLEMGANPNKVDFIGMTAVDALFIGDVDEIVVKKILKALLTVYSSLCMHKNVFDTYYVKYQRSFFTLAKPKLNFI